MDIKALLDDKSLKPKPKTEKLSLWIIENPDNAHALLEFAAQSKDNHNATCIEAMEYATQQNSELTSQKWLEFVTLGLTEKTPRVKWESAKVIGNIAHLYPKKLEKAIANLLTNAEDSGTVVRWSAAFALGQIIKMKSSLNKSLMPAIESLAEKEERNSIRKIYLDALKKSK
jgi:HEAT repeat protein